MRALVRRAPSARRIQGRRTPRSEISRRSDSRSWLLTFAVFGDAMTWARPGERSTRHEGPRRCVFHRDALQPVTVPDFYPIEYLPRGVRLTCGGDASDLPAHVLQDFLNAVAAGDAHVPIHRTYRMNEISQAHADMEAGKATRKLVVLP